MGNLCQIGTESRSDPNQRIRLTDGVFCEILGLQHPLCRLIDRVWFVVSSNLFDPLDLAGAPFSEARFWWSWSIGFGNQLLFDAATSGVQVGKLCATEPQFSAGPPTYLDFVNFLLGQDDAILVKVFEAWKFRIWFDYCRCRPNAVLLPPTINQPQIQDLPGIPYCGGVVNGPSPAAIAQCLSPLLAALQQIIDQNAIAGAAFWDYANPRLQYDPYQVAPNSYPIGGVEFSGLIGQGWLLEEETGTPNCPQDFPYSMPVFPYGLRITCEDTAGLIEVAISTLGKKYSVELLVRAESEMQPSDPDAHEVLPSGWVFFRDGYAEWVEILGVCFHIRITPYLPDCLPTGGRFGSWNTPGPDGKTDDEAICLEVPQLCDFRVPDCCGGQTVLLDAKNQIALVKALGLEISQQEE